MPAPIVLGYHGTTISAARSIVRTGFRLSTNEEDWLGKGAYFFQDAPQHAFEWARQRYGYDVAVVRARIHLDDCMDMLDKTWDSELRTHYQILEQMYSNKGKKPPRQRRGRNVVDRELIDLLIDRWENRGIYKRCVRAAFIEGPPIFPSSALYDRAHVQVAVRDTTLIRATRLFPLP